MVFLCIASIVWSSIALHAFSNMYRLKTRAGVLPRSASSHFIVSQTSVAADKGSAGSRWLSSRLLSLWQT